MPTRSFTLKLNTAKKSTVMSAVLKKTMALLMIGSLGACSLQAHEQKAALLPSDSKQARAEIVALVSQSLGGKNIAIAEDVFQETSRLLLGKSAITSPEGVNVFRADETVALVFELVKQGDNCLLRRTDTAQEWSLTTTRCYVR